MTRPQRIERELPELMAELAPARIPDYFDSMLQQVARTPQRPAWRSPERWIAMGELARPAPLGLPSWRPLIIFALLALAVVAGTVLVAGSRQPVFNPAPPYGLAANGVIVYSADGDILALDRATGDTRALITGPTVDEGPWFSRDGSRLLIARMGDAASAALMVANADGSDVRQILPTGELGEWIDWSPSGDRVAVTGNSDPYTMKLIDMTTLEVTPVRMDIPTLQADWRPGHDQLVIYGEDPQRYRLVQPDGSGLTPIPTESRVVNGPTLSPDGTELVYTTWEDGAGLQGVVRAVNLDTFETRTVVAPRPEITRLSPQFSPDGTRLLYELYDETSTYRIAVIPVAGGDEVVLGDAHPEMTGGAALTWSPDGTQILVTYRDDSTTWLLAADGSSAEQIEDSVTEMATWQRVAP